MSTPTNTAPSIIEPKTVVLSYDDISRMKDFCCDENGVSRDFMDWYINDNAFFTKTGILIIESPSLESGERPAFPKKFVIAFNLNNPDVAEFGIYHYDTQKQACKYVFNRKLNLSMSNISVQIKWLDKAHFENNENLFLTKGYAKKMHASLDGMKKGAVGVKQVKRSIQNKANGFKKIMTEEACKFMCEQSVYYTYAMMYYFAKNKAKEITGIPKDEAINDGIGKQISAIYKYTGYVNINDAKIYKAVIKKDKNEPVREYGRHIEKWSVRGHYRRVGDKTIWIEPFEKGEGELEKRVYGTEKESEVNLVPKVFEVTRTVFDKTESDVSVKEPNIKTSVPKKEENIITSDIKKEPTFLIKIKKIWDNFKSKFKR